MSSPAVTAAGGRTDPSGALPAELSEAWAAARLWAAHCAPYLTTAVLALHPRLVDVTADGCDPAALRALPVDDRWNVHVHPQVLRDLPTPHAGFWLLHQVSHLLRGHAQRYLVRGSGSGPASGDADSEAARRWRLAADCEIDDDLPAAVLAPLAVSPAQLGLVAGRVAEEYDEELAHRPGAVPGVDCGSGSDGIRRTWDGPEAGLGDADVRLVRHEVAQAVAAQQRLSGDVPDGWQRWAQELLEPVVPWRRALAAAVRRSLAEAAGDVDYTYRRPSRRQQAVPDVVLPRLHRPLPRVAVVLDTSASMTPELLARAAGEMRGVIAAAGVPEREVAVFCCDTAAHKVGVDLRAGRVVLVGGGGTDLREGVREAVASRPRPDVVVVLTDGWSDWPERAPRGCAVVVGLLEQSPPPPAWARAVRIPERD